MKDPATTGFPLPGASFRPVITYRARTHRCVILQVISAMGFATAPSPMRMIRGLLVCCWICCPASAESTLDLSEDLVRLGITSTNMVPNQLSLDAGPLFFRAVRYAQVNNFDRVIADPGAYYFLSLQYSGAHVAWDKLSNLTIDLQGSELYFSSPLVSGLMRTGRDSFQKCSVSGSPGPTIGMRNVSAAEPVRNSLTEWFGVSIRRQSSGVMTWFVCHSGTMNQCIKRTVKPRIGTLLF